MKVMAICGSARKRGNTFTLLEKALEPLLAGGMETSITELAEQKISGCLACFECFKKKDHRCVIEDDLVNSCIKDMESAEAIILGSPAYFADVSSEMKAFIDRSGMVCRANGDLLKRKLGAAVVAVRRAGAVRTYDTMNHFFLIGQMIVVGASYWNIGIGREKSEVDEDEEGIRTMTNLGENLLWLIQKMNK